MELKGRVFLTFLPLLIAPWAGAGEKCEFVFTSPWNVSKSTSTYRYIENEFNLLLNDYNAQLINRFVNEGQPLTSNVKEDFRNLLNALELFDRDQKKSVENLIGRKISLEEAIALKLARGLGRTEPGTRAELLAFSGNYTEEQMARKDRVLELAGFSLPERIQIQANKYTEDLILKYTAEHLLYDNVIESPEQVIAMNKEVLAQMQMESLNLPKEGKTTIDKNEALEIYEAVTRHPIARLLNYKTYDKKRNIGFCFGRAMTAHLEARARKIHNDSIRKVFVVGDMKALMGDITWSFHVATAIKDKKGGWWVIDPFFGKVVKLEQWYEKMYKQDTKGTLRLYVTEASRFNAGKSLHYNKADLYDDFYNDYFNDLLTYYQKKAKNELPPKSAWMGLIDHILSWLRIGI